MRVYVGWDDKKGISVLTLLSSYPGSFPSLYRFSYSSKSFCNIPRFPYSFSSSAFFQHMFRCFLLYGLFYYPVLSSFLSSLLSPSFSSSTSTSPVALGLMDVWELLSGSSIVMIQRCSSDFSGAPRWQCPYSYGQYDRVHSARCCCFTGKVRKSIVKLQTFFRLFISNIPTVALMSSDVFSWDRVT